MKVLSAEQTRLVEQAAFKIGMSGERLMENAGAAATREINKHYPVNTLNAVVVVGQGNNGGDGYVVARKLKEYGAKVSVIMAMGIPLTKDSSLMLSRAKQAQISTLNYYDNVDLCRNLIDSADIIVDSIFGIGFHGAPDRDVSEIINIVNNSSAKKVALDLPSGLTADNGEVLGAAIKADLTISFIGYKLCNFKFPASNYCGKVVAVSIGTPDEATKNNYYADVVTYKKALASLNNIPSNAHKGQKGTALIIGGSYGMAGAPMLAARAAMRSGAGVVKVALPKSIYSVAASMLPEAVFTPLDENDGALCTQSINSSIFKNIKAMLIGPGIGCNADTVSAVARALAFSAVPTVIDADGLNAVSNDTEILNQIKAPVIITPHVGEMARLIGKTTDYVNNNRISVAMEYATKNGVITVLKGAYTVIATPDEQLYINTTGNEAMATAGSGDMLAGMIAAFLANGMEPVLAAVSAVCLHGAAGDMAANDLGVRGVLTTDMIERLPYVFKPRFGR